MKKLMALLAVLLCISTMTASVFAAEADAYTLYNAAAKKMEKVTSAKIKGTMKFTVTSGTLSMDMKISYTALQRIDKNGNLEMSVIVDSNDFGIESAAYYKDGYYYLNSDGTKTRTKMTPQEAGEELATAYPKDFFKNATVESVEDGQRIKVKIPNKYVDEIMGSTLNSITDQSLPGTSAKISNMTCTFTIGDNGSLKSQQIGYTMTTSGEVTVKTKTTITMKYSSLNSVSKIDFPSDLDSYKKV